MVRFPCDPATEMGECLRGDDFRRLNESSEPAAGILAAFATAMAEVPLVLVSIGGGYAMLLRQAPVYVGAFESRGRKAMLFDVSEGQRVLPLQRFILA